MSFNQEEVTKTLRLLNRVLESGNIEHRIFGSVIPASLNGKPHRKLNDIDLLLDRKKKDLLDVELLKLGYRKKDKGIWSFIEKLNLYTYVHEELLEIGFFAVEFGSKTAELKAGALRFVIDNDSIMSTTYKLVDEKFIGIPADTSYARALGSRSNPKRQLEFEVYRMNGIKPRQSNFIKVYLFGLRVDWSLTVMNSVLDIIGKIRVSFGKPYDFWR